MNTLPRRVVPMYKKLAALAVLIVALAVAPASGVAQAPLASKKLNRWLPIYESRTLVVDLDFTRFEARTQHNYVAWTRWDYSEPQRNPGSRTAYTRVIERLEFDCKDFRYRILSASFYVAGQVVASEDSGSWSEPLPDTIGEDVAIAVCDFGLGYQRQLSNSAR